ncbi:MAG: glycosyltransferase family 39 protein [Terracidiphilus sp.]|jgi:hypothetical protein
MEATYKSQSKAPAWMVGRAALLSIVLALAGGLGLRLWMLKKFFELRGDPLVYGELAKNLLINGRYLLSTAEGGLAPTLIRLPGYPLFLALCFRVFGMENYVSATWVQIALELAGCLLLADFAYRIVQPGWKTGAAHCTLWLAALCPFTAVYAAEPLTEAPTLFALALALWSMARFRERPCWAAALWFTFAVTYAALLRPDGALAGLALAPAMMIGLRCVANGIPAKKLVRIAVGCLLLALTPFAAWTARNWAVFHVFQPLAPRYANDPGQATYPGWQRWVKTWCLDFNCTHDVYWEVPGNPLNLNKLPSRAFDSPAQYAETAEVAADYNDRDGATDIVPDVDARFEQLAKERIAAHPLRSYLWLPLGRVADMWLRPRVENLPIDLDWWVYAHHHVETRFSWAYAGLNAIYLLLAAGGLWLRPRFWLPLLAYMLLRSALLMTVEAPEARYTLECFPMIFALGGVALYRFTVWVFLSVLKVKRLAAMG